VPVNISNWTGYSFDALVGDEYGPGNLYLVPKPGTTNPLRTTHPICNGCFYYDPLVGRLPHYWDGYPGPYGGATTYELWPAHHTDYTAIDFGCGLVWWTAPYQSPTSGTLVYIQLEGEGTIQLEGCPDTYGLSSTPTEWAHWQEIAVSGPNSISSQVIPPPSSGGSGGGGQWEEGVMVGTTPVPKTKTTWGQLKAIYR